MKKSCFLLCVFLSFAMPVFSHDFPEKYYQNKWCSQWNGIQEYKLHDKTRVDCLTTNYAVEFDFAEKWAESIGQALYYGQQTRKKPATILIIENPYEWHYYNRIRSFSQIHGLTLWYMLSPNYNTNKAKKG